MTGYGQGVVVDVSCGCVYVVCVCVYMCVCVCLPDLRGLLFTVGLFQHDAWPSLTKPIFFMV